MINSGVNALSQKNTAVTFTILTVSDSGSPSFAENPHCKSHTVCCLNNHFRVKSYENICMPGALSAMGLLLVSIIAKSYVCAQFTYSTFNITCVVQ